jgi:hypothetical protein
MKKDGTWRKQITRGLLAVCSLSLLFNPENILSFKTSANCYHTIHGITFHKIVFFNA